MGKRNFSWDLFNSIPVVGIVRNFSLAEIKNIVPVFQEAGLSSIEITMNTKGAADIIHYIRTNFPSLNTGAGTVCTAKDLTYALDAGAQFIVTPITEKKIIRTCVKKQVPVFPGAFTPTEIYKAWTLGASLVKVYPAKTLGAGYIKDIKAPFNDIKLLPTGGIGLEDIGTFRKAGSDGFGIGSPLFVKELIAEKNWQGLLEHFRRFVAEVKLSN